MDRLQELKRRAPAVEADDEGDKGKLPFYFQIY